MSEQESTLEERVKAGEIWWSEFTAMAGKDPSIVQRIGSDAYSHEIELHQRHAKTDIDSGLLTEFKTEIYWSEEILNQANSYGIKTDGSLILGLVQEANEKYEHNFRWISTLLTYVRQSKIDSVKTYQPKLEESIPHLAQDYANGLWKKAIRHARRSKRQSQVGRILNIFKEIKDLGQYGVSYSEDKEAGIKKKVYEKAVQFHLNRAEKLQGVDEIKADRAYKLAESNSNQLGMPLPQKQQYL
jgi:hypothetical protein